LYLHDLGIICALGADKTAVLNSWLAGCREKPQVPAWLNTAIPAFCVNSELPQIPSELQQYDCRNNRLLLAAYKQIEALAVRAKEKYGPARIGIVLGTSTSGIAEGEQAVRHLVANGRMPADYHYKQQELGGAAEFLAAYVGACGPAYTVSTTCSSSANALASARRLLRLNLCDAVIVGGSDALCNTTLEGFAALGAISRSVCNPFSKNRTGTIIGEGAALFLMSREPASQALFGVGASADAYHISAPRPDGSGAIAAMQAALDDAGQAAENIDYLNLHGTGTQQNDLMESLAVNRLFGPTLPCGSSKPATGHCLGAAGAVEAGLCWLLLSELNPERRLPPHLWDGDSDPGLAPLALVGMEISAAKRLQYCISNSFSFGGNNVALLIGRYQ
jgi:3-oxoacyl-[acyl-carrier-protein] synthase-1